MKFKVGDKVRVREDLEFGKVYENCVVIKDMKEYQGKEFIIDKVWRNCYMLKDIVYYWTDEMLEPIEEGDINNMNIIKLNEEYKNKMDILMNEYKEKVKELEGTKEEPFIKEGQGYFCIRADFTVLNIDDYSNGSFDKIMLGCGNCYPYTDDNYEEVFEEVKLIAERRKLQSEMEQFARQNNEGKIDWNDGRQDKYYLYIDYTENNIRKGYALSSRHFNTVYFTSEETAKKALEKFGDRIKKLYLDAEEV